MNKILCTWRVSHHADATSPAVELLRDVVKDAALQQVKELAAAKTVQRIVAEVVGERGERIAKHTWTRTAAGYVRNSSFD